MGKRESHTPKIEVPDKVKPDEAVMVKVIVGPHPNTMEHSIRWIQVYFVEEGRAFNPINLAKVSLNPGSAVLGRNSNITALGYQFFRTNLASRTRPRQ